MRKVSIQDAKARLRIPQLWRHFGFQDEPQTLCHSPFREDRKPSFSVSADGMLWNDFATGEAGDAVDFLQRASGLSREAACRKFIELAAGFCAAMPRAPLPITRPASKPKPCFPAFRQGSAADHARLSDLRSVSRQGLQLAQEHGLLWFARIRGVAAWIVTDTRRVNAQARRLDGMPFEHVRAKAWTLPGSWAGWPIGADEARPFPAIALCEGGADLLAACHFIHCEARETDCAPVAMLGATQRIHADALPAFAGKRIRIFGHTDPEGGAAVEHWARQLESVGADVDAFNFAGLRKVDGSPVKDLNDCTRIHADDFEANRELWAMLP
jgi:hypothetical protein